MLAVKSDRLDNTQGKVIGQEQLDLHARHGLDNTQGLLGAGEMLTVSSEGELNNHHGTVQGNGQTTVSARDIRNEAGMLLGGQRLELSSKEALNNHEGKSAASRSHWRRSASITLRVRWSPQDMRLTAQQAKQRRWLA